MAEKADSVRFSMKKMFVSVCLAAAFLFAGKSEVSAQCFSYNYWHSQLTQAQRNSYLVTIAQLQLGTYGGECKPWVQNTVSMLCGVGIPANATILNPWYWQPSANNFVQQLPNNCIVPGCIIQMRWTNQPKPNGNGNITPHTAIVAAVTSAGMVWIDSNWQADKYGNPDGIVRTHFVDFGTFAKDVGAYYSVYIIK
jgi:hypothetical protein